MIYISILSLICFIQIYGNVFSSFDNRNFCQQNQKKFEAYKKEYEESIAHPIDYWSKKADALTWFKHWNVPFVFDENQVKVTWFEGGKLNVSYNCLDRHLNKDGDKLALIWQGEAENNVKKYTYKDLYEKVCQLAGTLQRYGIKKGDRICIYLPMIPDLLISMLACARIGAIHTVVFGGFSYSSLKDRIEDSKCRLVITADGGCRNGKIIPLKSVVDKALIENSFVEKVFVIKNVDQAIVLNSRDVLLEDEMTSANKVHKPLAMDAEDPLFILYTSGTTGKPKGMVHSSGGYLLYANQTFKRIFDYRSDDVYWCTADLGWITGHSYVVYGPLSAGATVVMFEGVPTYPTPDRYWEIIEKFKVSIFYTSPTAIRSLMSYGDSYPNKFDLSSLRILGSVGESINSSSWKWFYKVIGKEQCPIMDTWWQTETGGILISPVIGSLLKPGCAMKPFFGINPKILDENGRRVKKGESGFLVVNSLWPGIARTIFNDHERFIHSYWQKFPGYYFAGDAALCDDEGDIWLKGRVDDVLNVSGHRLGTTELENVLSLQDNILEVAVVGYPHPIKGEGIHAFVVSYQMPSNKEEAALLMRKTVASVFSPIAKPDKISFCSDLPKTRSGKIVRRILRLIAQNRYSFGDISTLNNPHVLKELCSCKVY